MREQYVSLLLLWMVVVAMAQQVSLTEPQPDAVYQDWFPVTWTSEDFTETPFGVRIYLQHVSTSYSSAMQPVWQLTLKSSYSRLGGSFYVKPLSLFSDESVITSPQQDLPNGHYYVAVGFLMHDGMEHSSNTVHIQCEHRTTPALILSPTAFTRYDNSKIPVTLYFESLPLGRHQTFLLQLSNTKQIVHQKIMSTDAPFISFDIDVDFEMQSDDVFFLNVSHSHPRGYPPAVAESNPFFVGRLSVPEAAPLVCNITPPVVEVQRVVTVQHDTCPECICPECIACPTCPPTPTSAPCPLTCPDYAINGKVGKGLFIAVIVGTFVFGMATSVLLMSCVVNWERPRKKAPIEPDTTSSVSLVVSSAPPRRPKLKTSPITSPRETGEREEHPYQHHRNHSRVHRRPAYTPPDITLNSHLNATSMLVAIAEDEDIIR